MHQHDNSDALSIEKRTAHVCHGIDLGEVVERTKTGGDRLVLLDERALHALAFAKNRQTVGKNRQEGSLKRLVFSRHQTTAGTWDRRLHHAHRADRPRNTAITIQTAIQLSSRLCDNMRYVWHEPRIHFPATRPTPADVAVYLCAMDQLTLRLECSETYSRWVRNCSRLQNAQPKLLKGKVIDLHSKYHDAVRRQAVVRERLGQIWCR